MRRLFIAFAAASLALSSFASRGEAQRLFRTTDPVEVTFTTNLKLLVKDRDSTKMAPHGAVMSFKEADGKLTTMPVSLTPRGHFRRQARNCDFPPLYVQFKKKAADNTLMQGNTKLKLTTNCKPKNTQYEQYILQEYAVYRVYQRVSPIHFRTRIAHVTYKDSANATPDVVTWAFFIEDDKEVAKQFSIANEKSKGALFDQLETKQLATTSLFEYFVGNTDWSVSQLHNIALLRDTGFTVSAVAYDFDWSGVVNPRYAFPDTRLGLKNVLERLYRGPCLTPTQWQPIFARFNDAKPYIDSVYHAVPSLDPKLAKESIEYYADFFKTINDPRAVKREIIDRCQKEGN